MMVQTLLSHFYRPDESPEAVELMTADWIVALKEKPLPAIAEARRRWIAERRHRPTIAEFLEWVNGASAEQFRASPRGGRVLLPVPMEHDGTRTPPSRMSAPDLWCWHARIRASRKFRGLRGPSPVDLEGRFADAELDRQAEAEYLAEHPQAIAKPHVQTVAEREAMDSRNAFARSIGFKDYADYLMGASKAEREQRKRDGFGERR